MNPSGSHSSTSLDTKYSHAKLPFKCSIIMPGGVEGAELPLPKGVLPLKKSDLLLEGLLPTKAMSLKSTRPIRIAGMELHFLVCSLGDSTLL